MKKVLSVFLAVVMILSICTVGVSASDYVWIYTSRKGAQIGNYLYFPVYYDDDSYYFGDEGAKVRITLPCFYDPEILKPVEVTPSELLYGMNFTGEITEIGVWTDTSDPDVEITYPYFYADITFDGDTKINKGEVLFNVKMEIVGDPEAYNGSYFFDHFFIVEDLEQEKMTCCKWEVIDVDGNVVHDISSKIWQNIPMDLDDPDTRYILEGYEPFIPHVEDDNVENGIYDRITISSDVYHVRKGDYAYFPVYYDCKTAYSEIADNDSGSSTKIILAFLYNDHIIEPVEAIPSEQLYNIGGTTEIIRVDKYVDEDAVAIPYIYVEVNFDGCIDINNDVLFNVKFEVISDNFFDEYGRLDMGGLFDEFWLVDDDNVLTFHFSEWKINKSNGNVKNISPYVTTNSASQFTGGTYDDLLLKNYEPFIPPVEEGKLTADTKFESGETYYINNYEDLKTLSYLINEKGESTQGVTFVQTKDIVVNSGTFSLDENNAPLYNGSSSLPDAFESIKNFNGIFDGQNYTISGLYLNAGLFENCEGAEIKNIYIENSLVLNEDEASSGLGTISSVFANSTLTGCSVDAIVIGKGTDIGGVLGKATGSTVKYCRNLGNVFGGTNVGGMAGSLETACKVSACYNSGDIYGENNVGGFAGHILFCDYVTSSYNTGDVEAITVSGRLSGCAGGFAGYLAPKDGNKTVSSLYTVGKVKGDRAGTFCGEFYGMFFEMFNLSNCYYIGSSTSEFDNHGRVEWLYDVYLDDPCAIYPDDVYHIEVILDLEIYPTTEAKLKNKYNLSSEFVFDAANENDGYPMLKYFHKEHTFSEYNILNEEGTAIVAKCNSTNCTITDGIPHTHTWDEYTNDANGNPAAECLDEKCTFKNIKEMTISSATIDPITFEANEGKIYNFILKTDGNYKINISALEKAALDTSVYLNGELIEKKAIIKWSEGFPAANYVGTSLLNPTIEMVLDSAVAGDEIVIILSDKTSDTDDSTTRLSYGLRHFPKYLTPSSVTITIENTTPVIEEQPLFEFGVTAQHIRNKFDMLYYPVSFGFSMYDDADIRYSDICADVADLAFGCDTEVVMKYIYDATTLDFVYVYDDSWNGSVEVLEHGSTGMTGDEGQEYNYIILKAKFSAVGYADGKAPFFLKFAVVEDNFINSDGTVRMVIDNVPYSEDQLCVWNAWDHEGDSFDFSNRIEFKSSDYETSGQTYDDLLLEDDIIATDVDMPTVTFTPEHARKGDLAYYPCTYDSNVDYDEWVRSATGFKDSTTKIQIKVDYDSSTLELLDALPSKELYDLGGTVTIIETGDLYPDNPDYGHMKYAVVQLDFDALDFTDGCLFSLKFRVLQENFLDEKGRPIDLVNSFVADWVVTSNDGKSHDLRYYVSSSYLGLATFGSYEELILADYEPFDPTLIEIEDRFEIVGGATVMTQGGVNYIVGLQPSLTKTKFQSTYIDSENVTVEINMSTARYLGTGSTVTVKSEITGEVVAEYVVVIYGDVDGSATINGRDALAVSNSVSGAADALTGAAKLAANVEGTRTTINAKDAAVISSVAGGTMIIDQSTGKGIAA